MHKIKVDLNQSDSIRLDESDLYSSYVNNLKNKNKPNNQI